MFLPNGYHSIRWLPGLPGPDPGHFFHGEKVTKTPPGTPRSPIFAQSVCINGETSLPLNCVLTSNLRFGGQRDFACRPLKRVYVSRGTCRNMVLITHPREYP